MWVGKAERRKKKKGERDDGLRRKGKGVVYWIANGYGRTAGETLVLPRSERWTNELHLDCFDKNGRGICGDAFRTRLDAALASFRRNRPCRYAVVTDSEDPECLAELRSKFVSNGIVTFSHASYDAEKVRRQLEWILSDFGRDDRTDGGGKVWFTSDTHFNHANIIRYCSRPWHGGERDSEGNVVVTEKDVADMNEAMVERWNSTVGKDDIVWHLGDFCLGKGQKEAIPRFVSRLNGRKRLVMGNHDRHSVKFYYDAGFERVYDRPVLINGFCILSLAPVEFAETTFFNIAGHVHDCETYKTWSKDCCIVCVERHGYRPVSWDEIMEKVGGLEGVE